MEADATYLSDDFQNLDNDGNVLMDKKAYIGMVHLLFTAFKDFKWLQSDLCQEGDSGIMRGHFEGTHTGDLDLSALGGHHPAHLRVTQAVMQKKSTNDCHYSVNWIDAKGCGGKPPCEVFNIGYI